MAKYKVTWWARYEAVIEADTPDEAKGQADFSNSMYMGVDDEIVDGMDWEYEQVTGDASLAIAVANGSIKLTEESNG